ncbi:hypothetical protein DR62_07360 [Burkholderia thailandensis]|nr:hypothetical protein DR62_07360 [Burkholderia thailandensis]AOI54768.1 hypothetical protein WI24_23460 [Burkholderia thailandensis]AOJ53802.1 hypothetical protein AQ475_23600 [Burkholderia thailandensis]AVR28065.1 hypothetical protein A8H32_24245 [Burkholderia thailandensis]PJO72097.1 hypothetical protein CWD92_11125 [Burkholderia thailandensis]
MASAPVDSREASGTGVWRGRAKPRRRGRGPLHGAASPHARPFPALEKLDFAQRTAWPAPDNEWTLARLIR